jgi:hypothetical protein
MANEISSEVLLLEANVGNDLYPTWKKLACLTEKSFNGDTNSVSIVTDCNDGYESTLPGKKTWNMSFSGYANGDPDADEGSYETTYNLWDNRTVTDFRVRNSDNSYYREGKGFISNVSETSSAGDYLQFSGTITGNGVVYSSPVS